MATRTGSAEPDRLAANLSMLVAVLLPIAVVSIDLARQYWLLGLNGQSPIVLAAGAYVYWLKRDLLDWQAEPAAVTRGWFVVGAGLALLLLGRSVDMLPLAALSIPLLIAGATLLVGGLKAWHALWKIDLILLAVVPLPGSLADALLVPMKQLVSSAVVHVLAALHFPVALNGVIISIGFYQLQVADACSGLWSLVALISAGLLFEFFVGSSRPRVLIAFLLLIPFIALLTNFVRVLSLVLTAYLAGAAAEKYLHDLAAYLEVLLSLGLFSLAHRLLERTLGAERQATAI